MVSFNPLELPKGLGLSLPPLSREGIGGSKMLSHLPRTPQLAGGRFCSQTLAKTPCHPGPLYVSVGLRFSAKVSGTLGTPAQINQV